MANSITIQLRPTRGYSAPSVANLIHNSGLAQATYWIKEADNLRQNIAPKNVAYAVNLWRKWIEETRQLVIQNKGRNPKNNQILIEEGLMVIGRDVTEKNPQIFIQIFKEFSEWFEQEYNTKILHFAFHNHEGHIDQNNRFSENLHLHFLFRNVDDIGESVRRKIKKSELSSWQTKIHEIAQKYIPDIERAINYFERGEKAPKHKTHRQYRFLKQKEQIEKDIRKIVELKQQQEIIEPLEQYAKDLEGQLESKIAKVKDLKEENKKLREQLKQAHARRSQYAQLEQFVKELKEKVKNKEFTIQQLQEQMQSMREQLLSELAGKDKQIEQLQNAPKPEPQVIVKEKIVYKEDTRKIEQLKKELEKQKRKNWDLLHRNRLLKEELEAKEQMIIALNQKLDEFEHKLKFYEQKVNELLAQQKERIKELEKAQSKEASELEKKIARMQELDELLEDYDREDWDKLEKEWHKLYKELENAGLRFLGKKQQKKQKRKSRNFGQDIGF